MRLRTGELLVLGAGGLACVAALVAAFGSTRWALVVLCAGVALLSVGLARVGQLVLARLTTVDARTRETRMAVRRLRRRVGGVAKVSWSTKRNSARAARFSKRAVRGTDELVRFRGADQSHVRRLLGETRALLVQGEQQARADAIRVHTSLDTIPSDTVRLARTSERLVPSGEDFPGLGGWAVTTSTLLGMLAEVYRSTAPVTVLECGSGSSTLFFALALAQSESGGRVVALESDPGFAEQTRGHLRRLGVDHLALVVDAPLVSQEIPGGDERLWFDLTDLPDIGPVHVLFVDGPVGATSVEARYPAFPCLADRLAGGGLVVLDDTDRPHEKSIQERWTNEEHAGRRLRVERTDVRATYFRVDG